MKAKREFRKKRQQQEGEEKPWLPTTELGKQVQLGKIESIESLWGSGKVIREPEIVDFFIKELEERILKIGRGKRPFRWVQRMTDSGRRNKYYVMVAVGNKNGYIGVGIGRAKEYSTSIAQAVRKAKLGLIKVERSCGSWECGCKDAHSISSKVVGKGGSVKIELRPAPKGTGLVANDITMDILELAGVKDIWSKTRGSTSTRSNLAYATFNALRNLKKIKR